MHNWSTDTTLLKKNPEKFVIWHLEQLINYGLDGEKLDRDELKKYLADLDIEPNTKKFLTLLLYGRPSANPQ